MTHEPLAVVSPLVGRYLHDVEAEVSQWRRGRRRAMTELADGLEDATNHYYSEGMDLEAAAARAVEESGPAELVGSQFAAVLANRQARFTALTVLLTGPLVGVLWLTALAPGRAPDALLLRFPVLAGLVMATVVAGVLTVLATGPTPEWLPPATLSPLRTAAAACAAVALCDVVVLTLAALAAAGGSGVPLMPALAAAAASLVRLTLAQRVARRDLLLQPATG